MHKNTGGGRSVGGVPIMHAKSCVNVIEIFGLNYNKTFLLIEFNSHPIKQDAIPISVTSNKLGNSSFIFAISSKFKAATEMSQHTLQH
jgi:hypothetical protein